MKFFQILFSLCLAFLLCALPVIQAQNVPPIPTAAPTPPNGAPGPANGPPGPPSVDTTVKTPETTLLYPPYSGN